MILEADLINDFFILFVKKEENLRLPFITLLNFNHCISLHNCNFNLA